MGKEKNMKISPINTFKYVNHINKNAVSFKAETNQTQANSEAVRTEEPNLNTYIPLMSNKMKLNENIKFFVGGLNKIDTDEKRKHQQLKIADIGCCDGALSRTLSEFLPRNTKYYGLDLSPEMLEEARKKDAQAGINSTYAVGNAFDLPYKEEKMDAIMLSSVMHELYSYACEEYNEEAYSKDSILHFMQQAYDSLKPGGVLIIKDPATAGADAWEPVKISNANKEDGEYPPIEDEEELRNANITKLCTFDKLKRFCMDFYPAKGNIEFNDKDECIMPRWLVTEFVRHRKWLATPENWAYEIKENYGTLRPDEMSSFAKKTGFNVIKVENISIPNENNIYAIKPKEFEIKDMEDNQLSLEDFPMFLEVVLRKPRN